MGATIGFDGASLVIRVPIDFSRFPEGQADGSTILLNKIREVIPADLIAKAKAASTEVDSMVRLIAKVQAQKDNAVPEEGLAGLVTHKRFLTEKDEELASAGEILTGLQTASEQAMSAIVAAIGGRHQQQRLEPSEEVAAFLASVERQAITNAGVIAHFLGQIAGFETAIRDFTARDAAENLVANG
jgi:hypothetical protein